MLFTACSKTDYYTGDQVSDYMPLQKGKYWIYLLDSTNFYNSKKIITYYQVKDIVDDQLKDNLNRAAFRLIRYIRPASSASDGDWKKLGQYYMTLSSQVLETTDFFNFKYQSLTRPFVLDSSWKGNATFLKSLIPRRFRILYTRSPLMNK